MQNESFGPDVADLFLAASRTMRLRWRESLAPYTVTPHQTRVLSLLGKHGEPGLRNSALAAQLHIAPRSTTEVVDQLAAKSLVTRSPDPADRRASLISLSPAGRELLAELRTLRQRNMNGFFAALDESDRAELARILARLNAENPPPIRGRHSKDPAGE